jgi:hypothetical protein
VGAESGRVGAGLGLRMCMTKRLKPVPKLRSETAERKFWDKHDTTLYLDW